MVGSREARMGFNGGVSGLVLGYICIRGFEEALYKLSCEVWDIVEMKLLRVLKWTR